MKHLGYRSSYRWVFAILTAGLLLASLPGSALAQRGRTDDGRRIERNSDERASKKGARARSGKGDDRRGGAVKRGREDPGKRGGGVLGDRDRDYRDGDRRRGDRRDWRRHDKDYGKGEVVFVPPGLAKKHVKYHHRRAHRTHVDVRVHWPWVIRYEQHWHPRVRARHVIHVDIGWGSSRRSARMEFETYYNQRVRYANRDYAVIDIDIEEVVIYRDGRYIGRVDRIPAHLSRATATVWRNGALEYDRDLFVVGNSFTGFELISEEYRPNGRTRVRAGEVDLRTGRVYSVSRSRLYDPYAPDRFHAQSLLPEDVAW